MSTNYYVSRLVSAHMPVNIILGVILVKSFMMHMFCSFLLHVFLHIAVRLAAVVFCVGDAINLFVFVFLYFLLLCISCAK